MMIHKLNDDHCHGATKPFPRAAIQTPPLAANLHYPRKDLLEIGWNHFEINASGYCNWSLGRAHEYWDKMMVSTITISHPV